MSRRNLSPQPDNQKNSSNSAVLNDDIEPLCYEGLYSSPIVEMERKITHKVQDVTIKLSQGLHSGDFNTVDRPVLNLLSHVEDLKEFYATKDANFKPVIDQIKAKGCHRFFKECFENGADPLLSIASAASEHRSPNINQETSITRAEYEASIANPLVRTVLNQLTVISAYELGLVSLKEAAILFSMKKINQLSVRVDQLYDALKRSVEKIDQVEKLLESGSRHAQILFSDFQADKEMEKLFTNDFNRFRFRYRELDGKVGLCTPPEYEKLTRGPSSD